jgi:DNA-binding transcriptional LysR family regulator
MDLASLRIFKAVAEHGGVNRAAASLHRVPSNVTTRVKQLEEALGTKLFVREKNRLALSAEGKVLLNYANQLLRLSAEAQTALRGGKPHGTLRIGSLESTAATRLPALLSRYHALYPEVRVELVTGTSGALVARVHAQELEAAFVAEPFSEAGLDMRGAFAEALVLIAPKTHARIRSPKDLGKRTVIAFAAGCSYRRRLETWLSEGKVVPEQTMEFQSYHAIVACVAAGCGIAVVPRSVIRATPGQAEVSVTALPGAIAKTRTQLVWRPGYQSTALDALKRLLPLSAEKGGVSAVRPVVGK